MAKLKWKRVGNTIETKDMKVDSIIHINDEFGYVPRSGKLLKDDKGVRVLFVVRYKVADGFATALRYEKTGGFATVSEWAKYHGR